VANAAVLDPAGVAGDPAAIAEASVRALDHGLVWKVDPLIFGAVGTPGWARPPDLPGPVPIVRGELSVLVPAEAGAQLEALIGRPVPQFGRRRRTPPPDDDHPVELGEALRAALDVVAPEA
jgi:hypothetical protein